MSTPRAFAQLHVKTLDEDQRIISGIATTPETDRIGDVIEPLGVTFTNPLPLLLYHDSTKPVGRVTFRPPTKTGIAFDAHIPHITEPGPLRDRVTEAWQSVKAGLLTGVSIGFRVLEDGVELIKGTGGLRYLKTEVLELSLVTVPANASAGIQAIRSYVAESPAPGAARRVSSAARDSGLSKEVSTMANEPTNPSDLITKYQASRNAKLARMSDLMAKADKSDKTLDADSQVEYDDLVEEVKALDAHIKRAKALEDAQAEAARPVRIAPKAAPEVTAPQITVRQNQPPGTDFVRMLVCRGASLLTGQAPELIAMQRYPDNPRVAAVFKAAVAGGTTTDATWAGPLVDPTNLASEFIEFLRPQTIIGRIPGLRRVPFNVRIVGQTSGASASWVGQGANKPVTKFDVEATTLTWAKIAAIAVFSDELFRFSSPSAEGLIRDELSKAVIARMDTDFIDPTKALAANVSPASITNGLVAGVPSGTDAAAVRADVATMLATFLADNQSPVGAVWIMPNTLALQLSLMRNALGQPEFSGLGMLGGTFEGLPVVTSQYAAVGSPVSNLVILANAPEIFLSDDGGVSIDVSREASIEMSDDPDASGESQTIVNMFQSNQIAIRAERYINWARRRTAAVTYMSDVAWGSGS